MPSEAVTVTVAAVAEQAVAHAQDRSLEGGVHHVGIRHRHGVRQGLLRVGVDEVLRQVQGGVPLTSSRATAVVGASLVNTVNEKETLADLESAHFSRRRRHRDGRRTGDSLRLGQGHDAGLRIDGEGVQQGVVGGVDGVGERGASGAKKVEDVHSLRGGVRDVLRDGRGTPRNGGTHGTRENLARGLREGSRGVRRR